MARNGKPTPKGKERVAKKPRASKAPARPLLRADDYWGVKAKQKGGKPGNPGWIPDSRTAAEVERLAGMGMLQKNIASYLGISVETWCVKKREYPELLQAMERGFKKHEAMHLKCLDKVAKESKPGAVQASIFKLKACHKYRDNDAPEEKDGNSRTPESIQAAILAAIKRVSG